jgi:hypothetical protein
MPNPSRVPPEIQELVRSLLSGVEYNGQPYGPPIDFEPLPLPTFLARPRTEYEQLLGPLVVRGQRLVIGAATGEGKSTLVWWIVKALATAGRFLDWHSTRRCRVLIVDAEQTDHDITRLAAETHLGDCAEITILAVPDGLSLNSSEQERQRLELLLDQGEFDVVVLDPLYKLHTGNMNDEGEAVALMRFFDAWRVRFNFALILPSHTRKRQQSKGKDSNQFTMDDIIGASAYLRGAEVVVGLRLIYDGMSQLYFFKSRAPGLPVRTHWNLRFDRAMGYAVYETPTERAKRSQDDEDNLVRTLLVKAGGSGVELAALMDETGKSRATVFRILDRVGAVAVPMPGSPRQRLYMMGDAEPDQSAMEVWGDPDDDDE